jgi:hypothetical protein
MHSFRLLTHTKSSIIVLFGLGEINNMKRKMKCDMIRFDKKIMLIPESW